MTKNQKNYLYIGGAIVVLIIVWAGVAKARTTVISQDTTIKGDYAVKGGRKLVLKNAAKLTVEGNFSQNGSVECNGGELVIVVKGNANLDGKVSCDRSENNSVSGVRLAVSGAVQTGKNFKLSTNRSVQIVANENLFADTPEKINTLYDEAAKNSGKGKRLGPFVPSEGAKAALVHNQVTVNNTSDEATSQFFKVAHAQAAGQVVISGQVVVARPPKGVHQVVVFNFPNASGVKLQDFELTGPDGNDGTDDKGSSCSAKGGDGEDAMHFLAEAGDITVNNFTLNLGSGGKGGDAETQTNCYPKGTAIGGKGGGSGNFKMVSGGDFKIEGAFTVNPGRAGNGGNATAYGGDATAPSQKGGDATATGGAGADNKKTFGVEGDVAGTSNIQFGSTYGGDGGSATAKPGKGGDGKGCNSPGGAGGDGTATGGKGGDASLKTSGGAGRTANAEDVGGNGGDATAKGGQGAKGGDCPKAPSGGNGGKGGDAQATAGIAGAGQSARGSDGTIKDQTGGNGGNGGSGCGPGAGGAGGAGKPVGQAGKPGQLDCPLQQNNQTLPPPSSNNTPQTTPPVNTPAAEGSVLLSTHALSFQHHIGQTACPENIGTVHVTLNNAAKWSVSGQQPWLQMNASGSGSGDVTLYFNCQLAQYNSQTVDATLTFQALDSNGKPTGTTAKLGVTGVIMAGSNY